MAHRNYDPQLRSVTQAKLAKLLKDISFQAKKDKKAAIEAYEFANDLWQKNPTNEDYGKMVVDLLKVMQSSNQSSQKAADLMLKYLKETGEIKQKKPDAVPKVPSFEDMTSPD